MIGLIFGNTDFPNKILQTVKKRKIKYLIIDLSKSKKFKQDRKSYSVSIGQFGKIINILIISLSIAASPSFEALIILGI